MTVSELIRRLQQFPDDWEVWFTKSGNSIRLVELPAFETGKRSVFIFEDGRPPRVQRTRKDWSA